MSHYIKNVDAYSHQGFKEVGKPNHYNEDRLSVNTQTFAVIDGATSLVPADMGGVNPSAYTSKFLAEFLNRQPQNDSHTALDLLTAANIALRADLHENWPDILKLEKLGPCAAAVVLKLQGDKATIANASDCVALVLKNGEWQQLTEHYARHAEVDAQLADAIFAALDAGKTYAEAREEVQDMVVGHRQLVNVEFGVFNAEPEAVKFFKHTEIDLDDVEAIALMSDGLPWPEAKKEEAGFKIAAQKMYENGVRAYYEEMKTLYDQDPKFAKYRRLKHMDDATGIIITLKDQ